MNAPHPKPPTGVFFSVERRGAALGSGSPHAAALHTLHERSIVERVEREESTNDDARCSWFFTFDNPEHFGEQCPRLGVRYDRSTDRWWCDDESHDA